jgi:2'-5' RNA ligase
MKPGALLLVSLIEKHPVGYIFERSRRAWPLHITLVPWFYVADAQEASLIGAIAQYVCSLERFEVIVGAEESFGPSKDVVVNVIATQELLKTLHERLIDVVRKNAGTLNNSEDKWILDEYIAHITRHGNIGRNEGDVEIIDSVVVVRLLDDNQCEVVRILNLEKR